MVPEADLQVGKEDGGKPFFQIKGVGRLPGCLSMSHSQGRVFCAFSLDNPIQFGVDVERIEKRERGMIHDFFTAGEVAAVSSYEEGEHILWVNLIWSAKEAFLKAIGCGLKMDTRMVEVLPEPARWPQGDWKRLKLHVSGIPQNEWSVLFRQEDGYVLTLCLQDGADICIQRWR
jgi:phosphopantetheinyl transferase